MKNIVLAALAGAALCAAQLPAAAGPGSPTFAAWHGAMHSSHYRWYHARRPLIPYMGDEDYGRVDDSMNFPYTVSGINGI